MAAGNWIMPDTAKKYLVDGTIDFDTDTIKMALFNSSYAPTVAGTTTYSTTNELSTANGYTQAGVTMSSPAVTQSGSSTKLTAGGNAVWTASGGSITARYAVLYKSGTANSITNPIVGYCLLDTTPADVTTTTGNTLTITTPATGFFTLTGATT
jgi:hypothetical protein